MLCDLSLTKSRKGAEVARFLAVLPAFIVLASRTVEGAKCGTTVLTAERGVIQTPNYPEKLDTPLTCKWTIDATSFNDKYPRTINVYLTQVHLEEIKFTAYDDTSWDHHKDTTALPTWKGRLHQTKKRLLDIEISTNSTYENHFRVKNNLNEFGLNITYEIVPVEQPVKSSCSFLNCSFAGKCKVTADFRNFYCECLPGNFGPYCEYNHKTCDPQRNVDVYCARGTCKNVGTWTVKCTCPPGWKGARCELPDRTSLTVCPGPDCRNLCSANGTVNRPCSCHNGRMDPKDWVLYEAKLKLTNKTLVPWMNGAMPTDVQALSVLSGLEKIIVEELNKAIQVRKVSITSVGRLSEFTFQFYQDEQVKGAARDLLLELTNKGVIGVDEKYGIGNAFHFEVYPALVLKSISLSTKTRKQGEQFSITCEAIGSPNVKLKWFKDNIPIQPALATRRLYIDDTREVNNRMMSILTIYQASKLDRGIYTCQAKDTDEEQCLTVTVDVVLLPIIEVEPLSLTLVKGSSTILICNVINDNGTNYYKWYRNGSLILPGENEEVTEKMAYPKGSILRILKADQSTVYTCSAENSAGKSEREIPVHVVDSVTAKACGMQQDASGITWPWTAAGETAVVNCPVKYTGWARRQCVLKKTNAQWVDQDYSSCTAGQLKDINLQLHLLKMGFAVARGGQDILQLLASWLESRSFLYRGEGEGIVRILIDTVKYNEKKNNTREGYEFLMQSVMKLLAMEDFVVSPESLLSLVNIVTTASVEYCSFANSSLELKSAQLVSEVIHLNQSAEGIFNRWYSFQEKLSKRLYVHLVNTGEPKPANVMVLIFSNLSRILSRFGKVTESKEDMLVSPIVCLMCLGKLERPSSSMEFEYQVQVEAGVEKAWIEGKLDLSCAGLNPKGKEWKWRKNSCRFIGLVNNMATCRCDRLDLLGNHSLQALVGSMGGMSEKGVSELRLHWSAVGGSLTCISFCAIAILVITVHRRFRLHSKSLYLLNIIVCVTIIISILLMMSLRRDPSSISVSTGMCSFLIIALCCQVTKSLHVLLSTQLELFPWLRSVSLTTLLSAVSLPCLLPLWTASAWLSHIQYMNPEDAEKVSVLREDSPVFWTVMVTIAFIAIMYMFLHGKAAVQSRTPTSTDPSDKNQLEKFRQKILNRSLAITICLLTTISSIILHGNNFFDGPANHCFFGFSASLLGMVTAVCYTVKNEYPIPTCITKKIYSGLSELTDLENLFHVSPSSAENKKRKYEPSESDIGVHSCQLLEVNPPTTLTQNFPSEVTLSTILPNSQSGSVASSNIISRSNTNSSLRGLNRVKLSSLSENQDNKDRLAKAGQRQRKVSYTGSSRSSSTDGFSRSDRLRPERGRCLLNTDAAHAEYVLPSISAYTALHGRTRSERETADSSSSNSISIPSAMRASKPERFQILNAEVLPVVKDAGTNVDRKELRHSLDTVIKITSNNISNNLCSLDMGTVKTQGSGETKGVKYRDLIKL